MHPICKIRELKNNLSVFVGVLSRFKIVVKDHHPVRLTIDNCRNIVTNSVSGRMNTRFILKEGNKQRCF